MSADRPWYDEVVQIPELVVAEIDRDMKDPQTAGLPPGYGGLFGKLPGGVSTGGSSLAKDRAQFTAGGAIYLLNIRVCEQGIQPGPTPGLYHCMIQLAMDTDYMGKPHDHIQMLQVFRRTRWLLDRNTLSSQEYSEFATLADGTTARPPTAHRQATFVFEQQGMTQGGRDELASEHMVQIYRVGSTH